MRHKFRLMSLDTLKTKFQKITFEQDLKNLGFPHIENCLIIGGAGTIGSNYIKQILRLKPQKIVIVDINENGLTELTRDLRSGELLNYKPYFVTYPVSLLSETFDKIFYSDSFDLVANFSAHKHVRSEKDQYSIEALVRNNVFGAIKLLKLCHNNPPKYFFSVSTDKAANPVNIMGASKLLMEKLILSQQKNFRVTTARFANVAFSNGSLLDGFRYRIAKKQPIACPSDIKRFFITPEQSGEICFLSTFLGNSGDIFFPKLNFENDQIYFKEIALEYIKDIGFEPYIASSENQAKSFNFLKNPKAYPIYLFQTDTNGEKLYEEFYSEDEKYNLELFNSLGVIKKDVEDISFDEVQSDFENIFQNQTTDKTEIIHVIKKYIESFNHIETGKNLDDKM